MFFNLSLSTLNKFKALNTNLKLVNFVNTVCRSPQIKGDASCKPKTVLMEPCCKVAIVTGGAEGIGFATAHQLLCAKANHVALIGCDIAKGLEAVNNLNCSHGKNKATFIKCDIKCKQAVEETFLKIKNEFKKVEIVVNAAGMWNEIEWEQMIETNFIGTINVNLAVGKCFPKTSAVVINLTGLPGLQAFSPSPIFSGASSAVMRFSQSLGHEINFGRLGIRIVTLCIGITCTDFIKDVDQRMLSPEMGKDLEQYIKKAHMQKADVCAKSIVDVIKYGTTGSVWVVEDSRLLYLIFPDWRNDCVLVSQFT